MLSLEQCRKIDPSLVDLPDEELLMIRDRLYGLANIALDQWQDKKGFEVSPLVIPEPTKTKV